MKQFFALLRQGNWRGIFLEETKDGFLSFFRYLFVGAVATVVDWGLLFLLEAGIGSLLGGGEHRVWAKYIAAAFGFAAGVTVNFFLSRTFVFQGRSARSKSTWGEFFGHGIIGVWGLIFTELLLFWGDRMGWHFLWSKILATGVVFFWNYFARKYLVYRAKK